MARREEPEDTPRVEERQDKVHEEADNRIAEEHLEEVVDDSNIVVVVDHKFVGVAED